MSNRFIDNETLLDAATLNRFEDDLKACDDLYLHKVQVVQGSGETGMIGTINVYTRSGDEIDTTNKLISALDIKGLHNIPMSGRYEYSGVKKYYNITLSAMMTPSNLILRGIKIGYSDSNTGVVTYIDGSGSITVTDVVSKV